MKKVKLTLMKICLLSLFLMVLLQLVSCDETVIFETSSKIEFAKILEYQVNLSQIKIQDLTKDTFLSVKVKVKKNKDCTTKVRNII